MKLAHGSAIIPLEVVQGFENPEEELEETIAQNFMTQNGWTGVKFRIEGWTLVPRENPDDGRETMCLKVDFEYAQPEFEFHEDTGSVEEY